MRTMIINSDTELSLGRGGGGNSCDMGYKTSVISLPLGQPRSQGLSSYRLGRARRDPGLAWSHATVTIENIREGSSVIRQFVALIGRAVTSPPSHAIFKRSLRAEISNSVYSDVYLKVRQVFLETINRGRDAVVVVPVGFMDSYELWTSRSSRSCEEQFYNFRSDSH